MLPGAVVAGRRLSGQSRARRLSVSSGVAASRRRSCVVATLRFLLKRFFAQRLLGLAIVVTLGFTIGVLVAGPIYADAAREAILSSAVTTAPTTVRNVAFQTYGNPSYDYEKADATLRDSVSSLPVGKIVPQGRGTVRLQGPDGAAPLSMTVLFREGATDHLPYRGDPPQGAG